MKQEISYSQQGDYQIPNITMPEQRQVQIGRFGRMRQQFLREKRKMIYFQLLTDCKLLQHLSEIDRQARKMQRAADPADDANRRGQRETEGRKHDALATEDEQYPGKSHGDRADRTDLQVAYYDRKTEVTRLPFFGRDADIQAILLTTPHLKAKQK